MQPIPSSPTTHCKYGHPLDAANRRITNRGHLICRRCSNLAKVRRRASKPPKAESTLCKNGLHPRPPKGGRCQQCRRINRINTDLSRYAKKEDVALVLEGLDHGYTLGQMTSEPTKKRVYRADGPVSKIMHPSILWAFLKENPVLARRMRASSAKNALEHIRYAARNRRVIAAPGAFAK
jgi:hypothetical protein